MSRHRKRKKPRFHRRSAPGASPGTLSPAPGTPAPVIRVMAYNDERLIEEKVDSVEKLKSFLDGTTVTWIDVDGLGDEQVIRQIGELLQLHALALEDVLNVHQRPKVEPYRDHLFIVVREIHATADKLEAEQISIFLGKHYVLTFQQFAGDSFEPVRHRIRTHHGSIRGADSGYLAYAVIDAVIDSYFPVVDRFADSLDHLEEEVAVRQDPEVIERIHNVRGDLLLLRRSIRPHRDALNELVRDQHPLLQPETRVFLRDTYDHTVQLMDFLDVYREMCNDLRDYYLSLAGNRTNEIMKVLTIIATIFIPLSFIAGLYGMNFNTHEPGNMPELNMPYGYLGALALMGAVAGSMLVYFWRHGWIGRSWRR